MTVNSNYYPSSVLFSFKVACSAGSACHAVHTPQSDVTKG